MTGFFYLIIGVIVIYLIICILILFLQNRLIFFPSPIITNTPKDYGLKYEEIELIFDAQNTLSTWWLPNQKTQKVLLYFHGNGQNISSNLRQAYPFFELGLSILLVDYRGYGKSKGKFPTEKQVYEDAQKAWFYLTQDRQISPQNIIVFGHSLGGAITMELATRHPEISALIIEGSFTSLLAIAQYQKIYNFLPLKLLIHQKFDSLTKVKNLSMPILFTHGTADPVIPYQMSEELYKEAKSKKEIVLIPQGTHHNIVEIDKNKYLEAISNFLNL